MTDEFRPSRRIVFHGLTALGVAAVLAGCGGGDDDSPSSGTGDETSSTPTPSKSSNPTGDPAAPAEPENVLAKTSEVPVGGGIILVDEKIVITQPADGEFKAFSAVCKHQGFTVTSVEGDEINCNHHGSVYDAETGDNIGGPAPAPLDPIAITVTGGNILQA